jgi:CheY-like chemotaxis protein
MIKKEIHVLLADDDSDDCMLFKEALEELPLTTSLSMVHNGEELMQFLDTKTEGLPHILFLDLNMPRKNGMECLTQIKLNKNLKQLPVIIFSTSFNQEEVNLLYKNGAQHYIHKPNEFNELKELIHASLLTISQT